jgi:TupA-like ATPgrasp
MFSTQAPMTSSVDTEDGAGGSPMRFSERIARRLGLWWGTPPQWGQWRTYGDGLHRLRERHTSRHRTDPEAAWRCCEFWQRTLINKWNSREFAVKHGCSVPELYWCGYLPSRRRLASLPQHFVVRPVWGAARHGVSVVAEGRDLLWGRAFSPAEVRKRLLYSREAAWTVPVLLEEFVRTEDGRYSLPIEYKCHTFGDTVAAIEVLTRTDQEPTATKRRYYTPAWEPFTDAMDVSYPLSEITGPPQCIESMLRSAARLGGALGTYVRIDFFSTDRGCVFNEFSSTPNRGTNLTPYCDEFLGRLWEEKFPHTT